ncbi:GNAT family N-acetyltransferase [Saccharomonospora xinjiangensis]|uniref:Putative acyltransferase n=1 Tax=Saccharomonospora xinjiangensis XJ-54 TaxID=882086 RepID=I0UZB9_9PSEU|nr:GNAT family N-acetyltransferase [Saccharomonospora xinjiangensis]EID53222.1 putative acyltransferase [Saccharomonospora xinjiangensis XJ-54]
MTEPAVPTRADSLTVVSRSGDELTPAELYALLRLRVDVFVVEQECPYPELDGRDLSPGTRHVWAATSDGRLAGCLRVLSEDGGIERIGRVCTAGFARGIGVGDLVMRAAMELTGNAECVLDAQTYATGFYARFGFRPEGEEFVEDGIPHITMRREG